MDAFLQNLINALQWGSFYALIALGYAMVYSILMLFNFTHGDVFMTGAYIGFGIATALLALVAAVAWHPPGWLLLVVTLILTMILTSFIGVLVERVGYRPLRNAPRASAAITGLMIGIILEYANLAVLGTQRLNFPELIGTVTYEIGGVFVTNKKILIVGVSLFLMAALHRFIQSSRWGMAMRAMSYDFQIVPLMGVSIDMLAPLTFAIGSALAAAGGVLYSMAYPVLDPFMGIMLGWKAFVAAILGGRGSILGAALAGFMLGFIEIFSVMLLPSTFKNLVVYGIVLLLLTLRPHGLFGQAHSTQLRL
ncbi:MAG: branched-chain amino acid ABC transporter permease [Desulfatitalea sp.]|nr:branched-chain amino acid ABC transporter permease [Desulfatitalea sp.]NNK01064.1 branched-chain amino acid ABC transporter permease [Desulfatitalea sp.]